MEKIKLRFITAAAILLALTCTLTGTSYAWFTLATNPEIINIIASVEANQNLEIALDDGYGSEVDVDMASLSFGESQGSTAGDPYTWGNLVDLSKAFSVNVPTLRPTKLTLEPELKFEYAKYSVDGRVHSLGELAPAVISDYDGKGEKGGVRFFTPYGTNYDAYAYSVTYWVRSNMAGDVTLSEAAKRANDGTDTTEGVNGAVGEGSYISIPIAGNGTAAEMDAFMSRMRVLFVDESTTPHTVIFEASITAGVSDGVERKYGLVTNPTSAGENPVYISEYTANPISLAANVAKRFTMYVYLDGEDMQNRDALLYDTEGIKINVQFDHSAIRDTVDGGAMTGDTSPDSVYGGAAGGQ